MIEVTKYVLDKNKLIKKCCIIIYDVFFILLILNINNLQN
jgi:hypothetical protein